MMLECGMLMSFFVRYQLLAAGDLKLALHLRNVDLRRVYAIVDIETNGGSAKKHRITEIAIIHHDGEKETGRYETLINPEAFIPRNIQALTGITNEMVADSPKFEEVAKEIWKWTEDRVFVAHNVNFDYGFIREHFAMLGAKWHPKRLCTVRLSRKLMPGMYSYSLGKLAQQLGHSIDGRHRAMGDCDFTSTLFGMLLERDQEDHIKFALNARSREATMPPNLDRKVFESIPGTLGVYIFRGSTGKILYIGKANNLKKRVADHFRGNTHTGSKNRMVEQITDVECIECPNELIALLTEAREIKTHFPPYNDLMKRVSLNWGVFSYYDQRGYGRYTVGRVGKWAKPIVSFRNQSEVRMALEKLVQSFTLCARYSDLQELTGRCIEEIHGKCNGACEGEEDPKSYNERYDQSREQLSEANATLIIRGPGFQQQEQSIVLIEKGRYKGHGIVPATLKVKDVEDVREFIDTGYDDQDIQSIIRSHLYRKSDAEVQRL